MSVGMDHLRPFLPGLGDILDDMDVSELMINGPGNVWVERSGEGLRPIAAPQLTADVLHRAAIHIARPLGLDSEATPILDARLADGSRVAICVPPASPHVAITGRRFGKRTFSPQQLVEIGSLTPELLDVARTTLAGRGNILVSGGTGSGKTTLLNALIELLPANERIVSIEDTLELQIDHPNSVRFEARELGSGGVTIRDLVKHSLRHRPDHIVVGEVRGAEAADLLQALNTGHGGSLTTFNCQRDTIGSRLDGIFLVDDDIELEVGTRLPKNMQRLRGAVIWSVPAIDHCSVLCLSQPSRADLRAFVDSNSMGDHAVAIHNPRELVQRVGSAAVTRGYEVWHGPVKYYDEKPDSAKEKGIKIDVAFQKLRKHEREQEYRILINTNTEGDDCLRLDVGSIRDIARYITPQDLANLQPSAAP